MGIRDLYEALYGFWQRRGLTVFAAATVLCAALAATGRVAALYIVTGLEDSAIVLDQEDPVPDLSSKLIYVWEDGGSGYDLVLASGLDVTIRHGDQVITARSREERISKLLYRKRIEPAPLEMVAVDLSGDHVDLTISSDLVYYRRVVEEVSYGTVRVPNDSMVQGEERVVQEGANGIRTAVYEVVMSNGAELTRQFVEEIGSTAVDEIVEYGTAAPASAPASMQTMDAPVAGTVFNEDGSGVLTLSSGERLEFSDVRNVTATAYTGGYGGVGWSTATGTAVHVGTVAVDPSVIPLGTRMYIVTSDGAVVYGLGVAEDTGVRGNVIDLYMDTNRECIQFGVRQCTVYILD